MYYFLFILGGFMLGVVILFFLFSRDLEIPMFEKWVNAIGVLAAVVVITIISSLTIMEIPLDSQLQKILISILGVSLGISPVGTRIFYWWLKSLTGGEARAIFVYTI